MVDIDREDLGHNREQRSATPNQDEQQPPTPNQNEKQLSFHEDKVILK